MTLLNYLIDNDLVFYSLFTGVTGVIGYSFYKSIWYISDGITDKDIDTSSNDVYSNVSTEIIPKSVSSQSTILPVSYPNIEFVSNRDIIENTLSNKSLIESKIYEINELFNEEIFDNAVTEADITYIIKSFSITELNSSNINEIILSIIENFNG